ncbi:MAG TPA: decarboxylating 6-phosphogluconate dehydrogenase [Vicinamibacterales bacterium]|nr:decarboxylating 6-phosphogluconate dehydrogenase [Vicinamibacterales bacterium]
MQLGFVGLGKMGLNMVTRLSRGGHQVAAFDRSAEAVSKSETAGAKGAVSLEALVAALPAPRAVWVMVPSGDPTESTVQALGNLLSAGDTIIDGGNTNFHDDVRRAEALAKKQITYIDAGVSGGVWGLTEGYCLMVGGDEASCKRLEPVFLTLAPENGYLRVGGSGSGHYVKMIHNGIEYGLMQAYAEGFELMHASPYDVDLAQVAALWNRGSVVRSWLLELAARALSQDGDLEKLKGYVDDSGEGRWTLVEGIERAVPLPVLTAALFTRFRSREDNPFGERMLAALRQQFGGHAVKPSGSDGR